MNLFINKLFASFLFTGFIKKGGGSVAALITIVLMYFYIDSYYIQFYIVSLIFILGTLSSEYMEYFWGHDSYKITIDEVAGILIAIYLLPKTLIIYMSAYLLFRFFDIFKPFPINHSQKIVGGAGVMLDDIISGIFANLIILISLWIKTLF